MIATSPATPRLFSFVGADAGAWRVEQMHCVVGEPMIAVRAITVVAGAVATASVGAGAGASWLLRGTISNERYVERAEKVALVDKQEGLGREASTCAALIPIRKNAAWWALTQDERRRVFEAQSQHIEIGLKYLPAVARRLHHCRDLASDEPFDFLTWFEYAPSDGAIFDQLLQALRASPEWAYVDRESDIRLASERVPFPGSSAC